MKLRDGFGLDRRPAAPEPARDATPPREAGGPLTPPPARRALGARAQQEIKLRVHRELLDRVDLSNLAKMTLDQARAELRGVIRQLLDAQPTPLTPRDREQLGDELLSEVLGLGPIEPLLRDPDVADILVNGPRQVYIERFGKLELTPVIFRNDAHLLQVIDRIVSNVGRRIDESSPMVDARLADGSRVNAIIPPLALDGPVLSIRRFGGRPLRMDGLIGNGSLTTEMVALLRAMVTARLNVLISGGTGSGKTTLLNALSAFIPDDERIITIEDSAELQLQQPHVVRLETRPPNIEGRGEITQRELVRNALRMRPDRILLGEVRGAEVLDMLQAMNTGHDGSISTIHANSPRDSLTRLEVMLQMSGLALPTVAMRQQMAQALDVVIQTARLSDGSRKLVSVSEIVGMEAETIQLQELFTFQRDGVGEDGAVAGRFVSTGFRPHFADRLKATSRHVDLGVFDPTGR